MTYTNLVIPPSLNVLLYPLDGMWGLQEEVKSSAGQKLRGGQDWSQPRTKLLIPPPVEMFGFCCSELWWLGCCMQRSFRWKDEEQGEESIDYQWLLQLLWWSWRIGNPLERRYPKRGSEWQGWNWEPRMVGLEDGGELVERVHRPGGAILHLEHCAMGLSIA